MRKFLLFSAALLLQWGLSAQTISGRVVDENGTGLPGASIVSTKVSTAANSEGYFLIDFGNYSANEVELSFSFIGYETQKKTVKLNGNDVKITVSLTTQNNLLEPVNISTLRAGDDTPMAQSKMGKTEIQAKNEGRDIPFLLRDMPSTVVSSDAGAGVGYTGIRIRGSDISRINVTINGIPLNDPESQGVFWVNTPDLSSSTQSIQVQRGVGTSTNGAGAFGASINLQTNSIQPKAFVGAELTGGSFNTLRRNVQLGSGLLNNHWSFEGRLSQITSDGFVDRASSNLRSYYLSGSYYSENTSVQLLHFAGQERTYQAWWGIPQEKLNNDVQGIEDYISRNGLSSEEANNLRNSDSRTYNFYTYENEVDDYAQDHYQLHASHRLSDKIKASASLHYTYGKGFFEQYKNDDDLADYLLPDVISGGDTITSSDLIRQRWLDNHFYGGVYSVEYSGDKLNLKLGGAYNEYDGDHFGEVIWARFASNSEINDRYYFSNSLKTDFNTYVKAIYKINNQFSAFGDIQQRIVNYDATGTDNDQTIIDINENFNFINPKAGFNYRPNESNRFYASVAIGQREPVRNDFVDAIPGQDPKAEKLTDYEFGHEYNSPRFLTKANVYYMDYTDQLVLTGEVNDVGSPVRTNVAESYRAGIELEANYRVNNWLDLGLNLNLSENKILDYTDLVLNYDDGSYEATEFSSTDISFSPNTITGFQAGLRPVEGLNILLNSKYVGRQYLDNTESESKSLDPFTNTDLRIEYNLNPSWIKSIRFHVLIANIFDEEYEPNGYTYSYIWGGAKTTEVFYFPMAGMNVMAGIKLNF